MQLHVQTIANLESRSVSLTTAVQQLFQSSVYAGATGIVINSSENAFVAEISFPQSCAWLINEFGNKIFNVEYEPRARLRSSLLTCMWLAKASSYACGSSRVDSYDAGGDKQFTCVESPTVITDSNSVHILLEHNHVDFRQMSFKGVPIPVFLNGIEVERPHAKGEFINHSIGLVSKFDPFTLTRNPSWIAFLDGFSVARSHIASPPEIVVHLDARFNPLHVCEGLERELKECLIVQRAIAECCRSILVEQFSAMSASDACDRYDVYARFGLKYLFSEIDLIPGSALKKVTAIPSCKENMSTRGFVSVPSGHVPRVDVESGAIRLYLEFEGTDSTEQFNEAMYLFSDPQACTVGSNTFHAGHWLYRHVRPLENKVKVTLESMLTPDFSTYPASLLPLPILPVLCERYHLDGPAGRITVRHSAVLTVNGRATLVIVKEDKSMDVVYQLLIPVDAKLAYSDPYEILQRSLQLWLEFNESIEAGRDYKFLQLQTGAMNGVQSQRSSN